MPVDQLRDQLQSALAGRYETERELGRGGMATVYRGSVRRVGNRVRVTAQLMNAHDGYQLWSDRFDRDLDDIFALQDELARAIAEHLELTLGLRAAEPLVSPPTDDAHACAHTAARPSAAWSADAPTLAVCWRAAKTNVSGVRPSSFRQTMGS